MPEPNEPQTQTYMAKSVTLDLTVISALIIGLLQIGGIEGYLDFWSARLSSPDFPVNLVKLLETISAVAILVHRTVFQTHPVAFIAPGQVKPVEVKSLTPTQPADPPKPPKE